MLNKEFIDINGLGHSGKGALSDLLREVDGIHLHHHLFEFDLIRIQGGLIDLKHNIYDHWSPIRSDSAIRRFSKLVKRMSRSDYRSLNHKVNSYGTNYEKIFNNKFLEESEKYIDNLILNKVKREFWPYRLIDKSFCYLFFYKISRKLNIHNIFFKDHEIYNIVDSKNFILHTHNYLNSLFANLVSNVSNSNTIILHNSIEPYNSKKAYKIIPNLKVINVIRDPRDVYASTIIKKETYIPDYILDSNQWVTKQKFLSTEKIDHFIKIQKMQFDNYKKEDSENILNIRYEDLVLDYDKTKSKIFNFLKIDLADHINKEEYFKPSLSKSNVGIWKKCSDLNEIKKIEKELKEYCYER